MSAERWSFSRLDTLALERGGACLTLFITKADQPVRLTCARQHEWTSTPARVVEGDWCPRCARGEDPVPTPTRGLRPQGKVLKRTLSSGGPGAQMCPWGHRWSATDAGQTCPTCADPPAPLRTIASLEELAKKLGGRVLSKAYYDERTGIQWQCAKKHDWYAVPSVVEAGTWCPTCAAKR